VSSSLERLKQSHAVEVVWRSYELRPEGSPPVPEWYKERIRAHRPQLEAIAREHYGLELDSGPFGINSRKALIGAKFAEAQGVGDRYHDMVFRAYWQHARSVAESEVLREIAVSVGLNADEFSAALNDPAYESLVLADEEQAMSIGLQGVPALIFAGRYLVSGAQPYDVLVRVTEDVRAQSGTKV
jgi:predicted DsbA family dithiol-disulfide isomerase